MNNPILLVALGVGGYWLYENSYKAKKFIRKTIDLDSWYDTFFPVQVGQEEWRPYLPEASETIEESPPFANPVVGGPASDEELVIGGPKNVMSFKDTNPVAKDSKHNEDFLVARPGPPQLSERGPNYIEYPIQPRPFKGDPNGTKPVQKSSPCKYDYTSYVKPFPYIEYKPDTKIRTPYEYASDKHNSGIQHKETNVSVFAHPKNKILGKPLRPVTYRLLNPEPPIIPVRSGYGTELAF